MADLRRLVAAALCLLVLPSARAAEGPELEVQGSAFDTLTVVASAVERPLGEVPATVTVIDATQLALRQVRDLADLLRLEPGVSATGSAGRFGLDGIRIRGVEGGRVAISVDGVRAPEAFKVGSFASAGRGALEPELLGAVEILRGPGSTIHGSDALGGAVVARSREIWSLTEPGRGLGGLTRVVWDGRDRGFRMALLGAHSGARWHLLGQLVGRQANELDNSGVIAPDPSSSRTVAAHTRLERTGASSRLRLDTSFTTLSADTNVDHLVAGPGQFASTTSLVADDHATHHRLALWLERGPRGSTGIASTGSLSWSRDSTEQDTVQLRAPEPRSPFPSRRERRFELDQNHAGGRWLSERRVALAGFEHRLIWGVELSSVEIEEQRDGRETNLETGFTTNVVLGERLPVRDFPTSSMRQGALFLSDSLSFRDGGSTLELGLRWDGSSTKAFPDSLFRESYPTTEVVDASFDAWTPRLAFTQQLGRGHSTYLQLARGFRAPPVFDTNIGFRLLALGYEAIPNPALRPERSEGVELGWRYAGRRLSAHLAAYDNRYTDLIESRAVIGLDPATGLTRFQSVNRDRARIRGVEGWLRVELVPPGVSSGLGSSSLELTASLAEGEDTRRDVALSSVDPAKLTTTIYWTSPSGLLTGAASLSLVGSTTLAPTTATGAVAFAPPGYELLDLHASWNVGHGLTARLSLLNALDQSYWVASRARALAADDPALSFHTEPGRAALLGLEYRF